MDTQQPDYLFRIKVKLHGQQYESKVFFYYPFTLLFSVLCCTKNFARFKKKRKKTDLECMYTY